MLTTYIQTVFKTLYDFRIDDRSNLQAGGSVLSALYAFLPLVLFSGDLLQTNSGAKEHLFYEMPTGKRKILSPQAAEKDILWQTWTGVLGGCVQGAWPPESDVTDINALCRHPDKTILATANDFGFVKLFNFPCTVCNYVKMCTI